MKKPFISLAFATTVGIGSMLGGFTSKAEAESLSSLKKKQDEVKSQQSNINSSINDANQKISNLQGQQADVQSEMERIDLAIGDTNAKIRDKSAKVDETKAQISKLQDEIKVIQDRIQKRNLLLKDRARNYQENGGMVNYLDVLMGSSSFSDFVDRASAVATIMQADQDILKQAEADKQELEQKQAQVKKDLASLQKLLDDLQTMNNQLSAQRAEKDKLLASLQVQEKQVTEEKMSMQEQAQVLAAQNSAIQKAIKDEQDRQAEQARQAAAAAAAAKSSSGGNSTSSAAAAPSVSAPPISGGAFTRPASGVISSTYGPRWGTFHYGVDFANSGSNVPIVAAADGVVVTSHYSSSYGNVVYIAHSINGQVYTTVYAHMERSLVSNGQSVRKGQQIGIMGNTGESTGQHLHFELYKGPWAYHSAINPAGIVPY
ncbi:murein hydrolase activator EnvC family protein [Neobacillus sp. SM06]|uniref:murein hydrolase activator EnvC family protein n=1 Tax=Neobacillus sp. SM06 TaxID=3422492 RepID=UPI003D28D9FE